MTSSLRVGWLTPAVLFWLSSGSQPGFLHIFDNSVSLKHETGDVISIVNPGAGKGPFNAVLAASLDFRAHFSVETPLQLKNGKLHLGGMPVDTAAALNWDPRPDWRVPDLREALPVLNAAAKNHAVQSEMDAEKLPPVEEVDKWKGLAGKLAGRGMGLTPAGDDFLMGVMHALWARFDANAAARICSVIAAAAAARTTTISGAWLRAAASGEAGEPWHDLLAATQQGSNRRIRAAAERILATGHSSGADAMAGFIAGISQ